MTTQVIEVYSDIDIELSQANDGDVLKDVNEEAIINSAINIINTMKGSRRMLPEFAADMQRMLFEPIDAATSGVLRSRITENIRRWDNRMEIITLSIDPLYDENMYKCLLEFKIKGFEYQGTRTIRFVLRRD